MLGGPEEFLQEEEAREGWKPLSGGICRANLWVGGSLLFKAFLEGRMSVYPPGRNLCPVFASIKWLEVTRICHVRGKGLILVWQEVDFFFFLLWACVREGGM